MNPRARSSNSGWSKQRLVAAVVPPVLAVAVFLVALLPTTRQGRRHRIEAQSPGSEAAGAAGLVLARDDAARTAAVAPRSSPAERDREDAEARLEPEEPAEPGSWGEREHYQRFLALEREELELAASPVLDGAGPDCAKVALLRALHETNRDEALRWYAWVLHELPDRSDTAGVSLPAFVVRRLAEEAPGDPSAREVLWEATWGARRMAKNLRGRAASALAAHASEAELPRLVAAVDAETDPLVRAGVLDALRANPDHEAVERWFGRLDLEVASGPLDLDG